MTISMIFTVPKPDGTYRGILNLSDKSSTGVSVNMCITERFKHITYVQQREIVTKMSAVGPTGYLWVKDLEDGFHNVPIAPADLDHLCIRMDNKIYQFQRLPMGLSSSPHLFTKFMHFPLWAISHDPDIDANALYHFVIDSREIDITAFRDDADLVQFGDTPFYSFALIDSYVDDVFGLALSEADALKQWDHSETIFQRMNLRCKLAKGRPPNRVNVLLGWEYDLAKQWVHLSDQKLEKYLQFYDDLLPLTFIPEHTLLSAIGKGRHVASIYRPLSAFARGLEAFIPYANRTTKLGKGPHIRNSAILRNRIRCLRRCMLTANKVGVPFSYFTRPDKGPFDFTIVTDASMLIGLGGVISDGSFFQIRWSELNLHIAHRDDRDIQWRELLAIYGALLALDSRLGSDLNDKYLRICTDNIACKFMLINFSAKLARPDLQILINHICELCVHRRLHLWLDHIKGTDNTLADALSRFYPNALSYPQHPDFDVGPVQTNINSSVHRQLQRGADAAHQFLFESNLCIHRKHQEFPETYILDQ